MPIYTGDDNGVSRQVNSLFVGAGSVSREVKNGYFGVSGIARECWKSGYSTLYEAYQKNAISSCVLEWEYERLYDDYDYFSDYTYVSSFVPSSNNILIHNADIETTSNTKVRTDRLVYHRYIYFFCSTFEDATILSSFLTDNFTSVTGKDVDKNISISTKTINSVSCDSKICSDEKVKIPYYKGASSTTYWKAYEADGYSDKWCVRVSLSGSFLLAYDSESKYARNLTQIAFL